MLQSFPYQADENTMFLVIGTMPSEASLAAGQYYAYKHNAFWKIVFDVFENSRAPRDYQDKISTLLRHGGGLWDSLAACERDGSLDSAIRRPSPNDFPSLFARFPRIQTLLFNGRAPHAYFVRAFGALPDKTYILLPSTSPAYAALPYEEKRARWREAFLRAGAR